MRIIIATGESQTSCLIEPLKKAGHEIVGVLFPGQDIFSQHSWRPRFLWFYLKYGNLATLVGKQHIAHRVEKNLEDGSLQTWVRGGNPDLLVVLSWPTRIPDSFLQLFRAGAMNIHPSVLPKLRGQDPIFSAIFNDMAGFGISFHRIERLFDSGPVLLQKPLPRESKDSYERLYFRFLRAAIDLLPLAIKKMMDFPEGTPQTGEPTKTTKFRKRHAVYSSTDTPLEAVRKSLACCYHHKMHALCGRTLISFHKCTVMKNKTPGAVPVPKVHSVGFQSVVVHHGVHLICLHQARVVGISNWLSPFFLLLRIRKNQELANERATMASIQENKWTRK